MSSQDISSEDDFELVYTGNASGITTQKQEHNQERSQERMQDRLIRVTQDYHDLSQYNNILISSRRLMRLGNFLSNEHDCLQKEPFDTYCTAQQIDYILLHRWIKKELRQLEQDANANQAIEPLIPFAHIIVRLCEDRQDLKMMEPRQAAQDVYLLKSAIEKVTNDIQKGKLAIDRILAYRARKVLAHLQSIFREWFSFYNEYDPLFTWWLRKPYDEAAHAISALVGVIESRLIYTEHIDIIGQPIGRHALVSELEAEMIAYSPEEIISIGETEYEWCEMEMRKASHELGFGDCWAKALELVKNSYVEPGKQPQLIRDLALEAINFVRKYDMITVPDAASSTWRMFMMSPVAQKANPFFLGGSDIEVSYPTHNMSHHDKLMSMRGNNPHFSRSTVFHELIPGHKLQMYSLARHKPYRAALGETPFWIEGWAFYWEMVLWDDSNFPKSAENRIGMLFWRMHRCARIIFSLKFHLGQMTPQECIEFLVDKVGFERANAEGEVRRSFNGDYSPLYQAAYMVGALQFYSLRKELLVSHKLTEKMFHDRVLRENMMPVELLRAYLSNAPLERDMKATWQFYGKV